MFTSSSSRYGMPGKLFGFYSLSKLQWLALADLVLTITSCGGACSFASKCIAHMFFIKPISFDCTTQKWCNFGVHYGSLYARQPFYTPGTVLATATFVYLQLQLDILAGMKISGKATGSVKLNGLPVKGTTIRQLASYVMQKDVLVPSATVREALVTSALLKLPRSMPTRDKLERVDAIMDHLVCPFVQHIVHSWCNHESPGVPVCPHSAHSSLPDSPMPLTDATWAAGLLINCL
jgi:hypothetical protein